MMPPTSLLVLVGCFLLAALAVELVRRVALHRVMDIPNERSSHTIPTPRGGGLGVALVVAVTWLAILFALWPPHLVALGMCVIAAIAVATVGWLDDTRGLSVRSRFGVHLLAGVAVAALSVRLGWPWLVSVWWLFWAVSTINVVNFMDGIDGLIASQSIIAALSMAYLASDSGVARPFALAVAGAAGGFLLWNWPPARIFLGDVGSGGLGYALVLLGVLLVAEKGTDLARPFLPLYPLFLDATTTIVRRARKGERITTAHRSHLYQRLANGGWGHARVTLSYGGVAVAGALIAAVEPDGIRWVLIAAYGLVVLVLGRALDLRDGARAVSPTDAT